jgi:serine/threonine protein kinase
MERLTRSDDDRYVKIQQLGRGTYGTVYMARRCSDGTVVAIKRLYTSFTPHTGIICLRELELALNCDHPHVASASRVLHSRPFDTLSPRKRCRTDKMYLEFPIALCDLEHVLEREEVVPRAVHDCMRQVSSGLGYLHANGIMHRDIKPNNVLIYPDEDGTNLVFKLADMGAAKPVLRHEKSTPKLFYVEYRAPELLLNRGDYTFAPDVWALGCVFVEVATRRSPFPAASRRSGTTEQLDTITRVVPISSALRQAVQLRNEELERERRKDRPLRLVELLDCRPRGVLSLVQHVRRRLFDGYTAERVEWGAWIRLLERMLDTDPARRPTVHEVVATLEGSHGSSTSPKGSPDSITSPKGSPDSITSSMSTDRDMSVSPSGSPSRGLVSTTGTVISIRDCPCRTEALELLRRCNLEDRWYQHAVDLVNRLTYTANYSARHLVTAVVSIVSKYWAIEQAPPLAEMLPGDMRSFRGKLLEEYELDLVRNALEYRIYRPLLCDQVHANVPRRAVIERSQSAESNGLTVQDLGARMCREFPPLVGSRGGTDHSSATGERGRKASSA